MKQNKKMKHLLIAIACLLALSSCDSSHGQGQVIVNNTQPNYVVTPQASNLGDNLNLQALGELVKSSTNAQDIENKLNQPNSINNLDLDGDGKVDYVKVTEYAKNGIKGFSFTVDAPNGQTQEVATVELQQGANNQATMNINGNQTIYGNNAYYTSNYLFTDLLIYHYLFYPHPYYVSPWHYGYYPRYYHPYVMVPVTSYRTRVVSTTTTSRIVRSTSTQPRTSYSPHRNAASSLVTQRAKTLSNPTSSQKSFSTTSNSRPSTSGFKSSSSSSSRSSSWFGGSSSRSSSSSSRSSSWGSSSRSSSRSSFGSSSRSSFGGRRR
jgi:hypothetical protein